MPYVIESERKLIDQDTKQLQVEEMNPGQLNYTITSLCHRWIKSKGLKYINLCMVFGVLITAMLELYRRIAAPYEDKKIKENGEVSDLEKELNNPTFEIHNNSVVTTSKQTNYMYSIAQEKSLSNDLEFWYGPNPEVAEMLQVSGKDDRSVIIRMDSDGICVKRIYRWSTEYSKWLYRG